MDKDSTTSEKSRERNYAIRRDIIAAAPALERTQRHSAMNEVQTYLKRYGYYLATDSAEPGILDEATAAAIARFQHYYHLPETGDFDPVTRDAMARLRLCGHSDLQDGLRFRIACPWDRLTLSFAFANGTPDIVGDEEFNAVRRAFATWAATGYFRFKEVSLGQKPDIMIKWIDPNSPEDGFDDAMAHADFPLGCSVVVDHLPKPIHFNESVSWSLQMGGFLVTDVETVALHEIGHILGLQHSDVNGAVMKVEIGIQKRTLHADDRAGLQALYGELPGRLATAVVTPTRKHLGNNSIQLPGDFVGRAEEFEFSCPLLDQSQTAVLFYQARHVSHDENLLFINGIKVAGGFLRTAGNDTWAGQVVLINPGVLKLTTNKTTNTLRAESRNEDGGTDGNPDDFVIDNVVIMYPTITPGMG
jgi:hypothetical protein